jgi:diguanylate cyclase (GGDEF)-like protein
VPILLSWLKQERLAATTPRWGSTLRIGALLLITVVALEGARRLQASRVQLELRQREHQELLQSLVRDSSRPLGDWAHWDDAYDFVQGENPQFVAHDMRTTALLDDGALMAIFSADGQRLALEGTGSRDRSASSPLSQCMADVVRYRLQTGMEHLPMICPSENGPMVGGVEKITDTPQERQSEASLIYLVPMLAPGKQSQLQSGLRDLSRQLVLTPVSGSERARLRPVEPELWTSGGRQLLLREPDTRAGVVGELIALAALVGGGLLLSLTLRLQWMLGQRRQRLEQLQRERVVNQRLRHTEREFTQLLKQVEAGDEAPEARAFARLLGQHNPELGSRSDEEQRVVRLAERFELVLQTARSLALRDAITGLPNRSYFLERLTWESERSRNQHRPVALLFINIDRFKQINEAYGHNAGDEVLQHVAHELERLINPEDFLARFGGDEFGLILHTDPEALRDEAAIREHAHQRALRLLEGFRNNASRQPEQIKLSLSIGIAISDPSGTTPEELIRRSDMAMVMAKSRRGERVTVFDIDSDWDALNNYRLYNALQGDIIHAPERFFILFQPIVDADGRTTKAEALCRWRNPDFPDVPADVVFALAERYQLIQELGRLILGETLREWVLLRQQLGIADLGLAINISPSQLSLEGFATWLLAQLSVHRIAAQHVTVEITESAVIETGVELTGNLENLRRAGVKLALDDFGTGYSSLRLLMWLKPDELKIDKSFVVAALQDPVALQIVRLLQSLTEQMQLMLVAEGVEDEAMFQLLLQAGLQRYQGYLFSRPLSRADLVAARSLPRPHAGSSAS